MYTQWHTNMLERKRKYIDDKSHVTIDYLTESKVKRHCTAYLTTLFPYSTGVAQTTTNKLDSTTSETNVNLQQQQPMQVCNAGSNFAVPSVTFVTPHTQTNCVRCMAGESGHINHIR